MLYAKLACKRETEERVRSITGLDFTSESFVNVVLHNRRLVASAESAALDARNWRVIQALLPNLAESLVHSHALSEDARRKIREIITLLRRKHWV